MYVITAGQARKNQSPKITTGIHVVKKFVRKNPIRSILSLNIITVYSAMMKNERLSWKIINGRKTIPKILNIRNTQTASI